MRTPIRATPAMAERISAVVHASFNAWVADDWTPDARRVFLQETEPAAIAVAVAGSTFAAVVDDARAGVIGCLLMPRPSLVSLLFVHPDHLRRGVARSLWEAARTHVESSHPETTTIELNSTPHALRAYQALGFVPISGEFVRRGCRATRMACWLPARALSAELAPGPRPLASPR